MTVAATPIVLDLVGFEPRRLVSANRRIHHMVRAEVCAYWRRLGHDLITTGYGTAEAGEAWHQRARVVVEFRFPDRRRRDAINLYPYVVKPLIDGCIDARLLPDDNDRHLVGPDFRRIHQPGPHLIRLTIQDTE